MLVTIGALRVNIMMQRIYAPNVLLRKVYK